MKKIIGSNSLNNEITIDYAAKSVRFKPIKDAKFTPFKQWVTFAVSFMVVGSLRIILPFLGLCLITMFIADWVGVIDVFGAYVWIIFAITFGAYAALFCFSLLYWNERWRKEHFPEYNFKFEQWMKGVKKLEVNKGAIIDNKFILPYFENVGINYTTTGDFAKYLVRVEVKSHFVTDEGSWFCVFFFSQSPVKGTMHIEYV